VTVHDVEDLYNGTLVARKFSGDWQQTPLAIAEALDCSPESIFDYAHQWGPDDALSDPSHELALSESYWRWTMTPPERPDDALEEQDFKRLVAYALQKLNPKEERILRLLYGIGVPKMTLDGIGQSFSVTRERVRQISEKAIRKLRDRGIARRLKWSIEGELDDERIRQIESQEWAQECARLDTIAREKARAEAIAKAKAEAIAQERNWKRVRAKAKKLARAKARAEAKAQRALESVRNSEAEARLRLRRKLFEPVDIQRTHISAFPGIFSGTIPWPNLGCYECKMKFFFDFDMQGVLVIKSDGAVSGHLDPYLLALGFKKYTTGIWINRQASFSIDEFIYRLPETITENVKLDDVTVPFPSPGYDFYLGPVKSATSV
jgi:RNA polymerase sigma factor (sigma-70 family)